MYVIKMVLTRKQKLTLEEYLNGKAFSSLSERNKFNKTLVRVQNNIDRGLEYLLWMAKNCSDILLDEARELENDTLEPHRRLKMLFKIIGYLNPRFQIEIKIKSEDFKLQ